MKQGFCAYLLFIATFNLISADLIFDGNAGYAVNGDGCVLYVPNNPLTPQGLMTPYILTGSKCNQTNILISRFVHGVIVNNETGEVSVYNPLVITKDMRLVSPPVPVNFTINNHVVGLWFGSNENYMVLGNDVGIVNGRCVTGPQGSPFGLFAWCNADKFFEVITNLYQNKKLKIPPLGMAVDGHPCPTIRDFFITDKDPENGVPTTYLVTQTSGVIQNTKNNIAKYPIMSLLVNEGDSSLFTEFINPAIGCASLVYPDLADPGVYRPANPMNDLQAIIYQQPPVALLPNNDPMTTTNGQPDLLKLNLYRLGIDQPQSNALGGDNDPATYCRNYANNAPMRFKSLSVALKNYPSIDSESPNLFVYMKKRAMDTYTSLNCQKLTGLPDPFAALQ